MEIVNSLITKDSEFLKELNVNLSRHIPHKWRVQSFSKNKPVATLVAYIDSRDASDVLNEYAIYGWSDEYYEVSGNTYCKVGIVLPSGKIMWKSDVGVDSNTDPEKGKASDAFKRACVKWGIGRFLYNLGNEYVTASEVKTNGNYPYLIDEQGKRIYDINAYVNNKRKSSHMKQMEAVIPATMNYIENLGKPAPEPAKEPVATAIQPNTSFDDGDRKAKALASLKKVKAVNTIKGLIAKQKEFKATEEGKELISGASLEDLVKLNTIELVGAFYKFVK